MQIPSPELLNHLRQAVKLLPEAAALQLHLATLLLQLPDTESAREAAGLLASQVKANPHPDSQLLLAQAYFQQGKHSAARVILEQLSAPEVHAAVQLLLARVCLASGDLPAGQKAYRAALEADPSRADTQLAQGLLLQVSLSLESAPQTEAPPAADPAIIKDLPPAVPQSQTISQLLQAEGRQGVIARRPSLTFADVGGLDEVKEALAMKLIRPLQQPELFQAYGKSVGGGLLMYGPPGCGKTYLARAVAGEVAASFYSVGLNEILDMWLGQSERNLHALFEQARANRPAVLFFDEVDALGASRSDLRQSAGRQLINQFLTELDGLESNEGILILAATNAPWHLDVAFRRPGRFDRLLFVPPPDQPAREAILQHLLLSKPTEKLDIKTLAKKSAGFSGADLRAWVDRTLEHKLQEALRSQQLAPLTQKDLLKTLKNQRPSVLDWFSTARNYAQYANQSGLYDELLQYLKQQ
ncbi:MAG: AAA family ATPase [Candidatus Sericytochromatia bacterium]|nr:AAA family ATPase [Candidatus Sericytochromatia bacterium]